MARYAESTACRRAAILPYFSDPPPTEPCNLCDNCAAESAGRESIDVSADARIFLACVRETRQRFGVTHVIEVLRASKSAKVLHWKHDQLPAYGSGRHLPADRWRLLADRFIENGVLDVEMEHGTLRLTEAGVRVLAGEPVYAIVEEPKPAVIREESIEYDPALFEQLRRLRREIAIEEGVPPYVVFSDRSLMEMSSTFPRDRDSFNRIHGVGERKLAAYSDRFLECIHDFTEKHGTEGDRLKYSPSRHLEERGRRHVLVGEAFASGRSITDLQSEWGVTKSTIIQHLYRYINEGEKLDVERISSECTLSEEARRSVSSQFDTLGFERLGPVHAALNESVSYEDLHLLRLIRIISGTRPGGDGCSAVE
jgi:ATP-dependent DNA helicase RecQ